MSNSKQDLIQHVISALREDLDILRKTALETHKDSTGDNSKAEGKYDTRGLEASYLAEAQAAKVVQLEESIGKLEQIPTGDFDDSESISQGAMVLVSTDSDELSYIILPAGGGMTYEAQGLEFTVITPVSPIGSLLVGKSVGDSINLAQHGEAFISDLW